MDAVHREQYCDLLPADRSEYLIWQEQDMSFKSETSEPTLEPT